MSKSAESIGPIPDSGSPDLYRQLVGSVSDYAIFALDLAGAVITWNPGAHRILGYTADDIIGEHFSTFSSPEDIARGKPSRHLEIAANKGRYNGRVWRARKDGSRFRAQLTLNAMRNGQGELAGYAVTMRELAGQPIAEEELRQSEERFRLLVQSVKDYVILILGPEGRITSWNEGAERIYGYTADEIIGQSFVTFYPQEAVDAGFPQYELEVAARDGRFEDEGWRVREDGSRFWANVIITPLRNTEGELVGFAKVTRDLTARRAAEEQARQLAREEAAREEAEKAIRARDEFVATISHDLRNPLTAAQAQVQSLQRQISHGATLSAKQLEARLETIESAVKRLSTQIDELNDSALLQAGRPLNLLLEPADLVALSRETVKSYRHVSETHSIRFDPDVPSLMGEWDARRLERVVANLLSNAIKYSPAGDEIVVKVSREGSCGVLSVTDHGIGIPEQDLAHIFERYQRASNVDDSTPGTGLGLASARDIIAQHGGSIKVQSTVGVGTTFVVRLPATPEQ